MTPRLRLLLLLALAALGLFIALLNVAPVSYAARPPGVDRGGRIVPPTALPTPRPLTDLVQQADLIADAEIVDSPDAYNRSYSYELHIVEWLKGSYNKSHDTFFLTWLNPYRPERPSNFVRGNRFIVFLTGDIKVGSGCAAYYFGELAVSVTDDDGLSAFFEVKDGAISYTPLPQYQGWNVSRFESAIRAIPSTPSPTATPTPVWSLDKLVHQSEMIAEVHIAPPTVETSTLLNVGSLTVKKWFKNPYKLADNGLRLLMTRWLGCLLPDSVDNDYILFLRYAEYPDLISNPRHWITRTLDGSTFMVVGYSNLAGVFEVRDGRISQAGVPQYQGWAVADFEAAIRAALPPIPTATPAPPLPTATPTATPWTLAKLVQQADAIAEVEYAPGDISPAAGAVLMHRTVRNWLKSPKSAVSLQINLIEVGEEEGRLSRVSDHSLLFLMGSSGSFGENSYYLLGSTVGVFEIRDQNIGYAGIPQYQGWAVADFEAAIRALLAHPELGASVSPH